MLSRHVGWVLHCPTGNKPCDNRSLWKLIGPLKPCHHLSFLFPFRNRLIGQTNEASEDEDENVDVVDWKAGSETTEVGAREFGVNDTDMVNKDSMFIYFGSCLRELLNTKIPERYKCDSKLEKIDFKYIGRTLHLKWVGYFVMKSLFLIGLFCTYNWKNTACTSYCLLLNGVSAGIFHILFL